MKRYIVFILFTLVLILAACQPEMIPLPITAVPSGTPAPNSSRSSPTPAATLSPSMQAALNALANQLGLDPAQVQVVSVADTQWPDTCLGLPKADEMCGQVITQGYLVVLSVGGKTVQVRTNSDGSNVRIGEPSAGTATPGAGASSAVLAAEQALAQKLGVSLDQVKVVKVESVDWPNGCLGIEMPGKLCTQVITPGFRLILAAGGQQFEYHTNWSGQAVFLAEAQLPRTANKVLVWEETSGSTCNRLEAGPDGAAIGSCSGVLLQGSYLSADRASQLEQILAAYAPFFGGTKAGVVRLDGQGAQPASVDEQRAVAEWARLVFHEQQSGQAGAARGLVMGWHRQGGIAGFCDDLKVYASGWGSLASCKDNPPAKPRSFRLSASQLHQLYLWIDQFAGFEYDHKDSPTASDQMEVGYSFQGYGTALPSDAQKEEIAQFASDILAQDVQK